jgi:hypothetical protein
MGQPVTITPDAGPVTITPDQQTPPHGFLANLGSDLKGMIHMPSAQNPYPGMGQEDKAAAAAQSSDRDQSRKAAGYSAPYRALAPVAESVGANVSGMEDSAREGDPGGVLGHAAAVPVTYVAGRAIREAAPPVIRGVARGTNKILEKAPGVLGAAAGGALGHTTGIPGGATLGAGVGYAVGKDVLPSLRIPGEQFGLQKPVYPGAHLPEAPPIEVIKARGLAVGGHIPEDPAAGLGGIPLRGIPSLEPEAAKSSVVKIGKPGGRLILSPEEAQSADQIQKIATRRASQRGMQYAAGMRPAGRKIPIE